MAGEELPQDLGGLLRAGGAEHALDVDLPAGRLVAPRRAEPGTAPSYWLSDEPGRADLWVRLHQAHLQSGLWPVFATGRDSDPQRPWVTGEVTPPRPVGSIGRFDVGAVLEGFWADATVRRDDFSALEPFGRNWPGLAPGADGGPDADEFADRYVLGDNDDDDTPRIMLVPAARGADLITAVGWRGSSNYSDTPPLSSVLRSWEDRFGARVIGIGYDTLHLTVAAPPVTAEHAEHVAAEHFAFCPDIVVGDRTATIRQYVTFMVLGQPDWWFWWD